MSAPMNPEARETLRRLARELKSQRDNGYCGALHRTPDGCGADLTRGKHHEGCKRAALGVSLTAALDALDAREWRPIETAPKNGTRVLVAFDGRAWEAHYKVGVFGPQWWAENGGILHPTHWQPLPPTPSPEDR
jgi:hypothetical protein